MCHLHKTATLSDAERGPFGGLADTPPTWQSRLRGRANRRVLHHNRMVVSHRSARAGWPPGGTPDARRRCAGCRSWLPAAATPRRQYCSAACRQRQYRRRKTDAHLAAAWNDLLDADYAVGLLARGFDGLWPAQEREATLHLVAQHSCPGCRRFMAPSLLARRDKRYCSARCRTAAWRSRQRQAESPGGSTTGP
jgi:hypothetical protein